MNYTIEDPNKRQYLNRLNRLRNKITELETEIILLKSNYLDKNVKLKKGQKVNVRCTEITLDGRTQTTETAVFTGQAIIDKEGDIWYEILFNDGYLTESRIQYLQVVT